jgi:transporter family-2 protein
MNVLLVILNGCLLTLAVASNALLIKGLGKFSAVLALNVTGIVIVGFYFFIIKKQRKIKLSNVPKYLFLSGAMGIISTIFSSLAALNIGITLAVAAALSTRIVTAGTIDHFGFFEREKVRFSRDRILGFALMFIGIFIMTLKI